MRQTMNSSVKPTSAPSTLIAPIGGWNTRDPLANTSSKYAIVIDNYFPRTTDLQLRKGITRYKTAYDIDNPTRPPFLRLFSYMPQDNSAGCLFAVSDEGFMKFNTIASSTPELAISSAATNGLWQAINFNNAGGNWLWCCCGDGTNKARVYNGTTWTILDGDSTPALDYSAEWTDVCSFKRRLWLARKDSSTLYYLDVLAIAGTEADSTLHKLQLGSLWNKGGSILKIMSVSLDAGEGSDDYLAIFSTEGQVCLYKGTNPSADDDWELVGVYDIPRPISNTCFAKYGGDVVIMTENGLLTFSSLLQSVMIKNSVMSSDIIQTAWADMVARVREVGARNGRSLQQAGKYCGIVVYPEQNMLVCNFLNDFRYNEATQEQSFSYVQFVMNTLTGAWCRFKNLNLTWLVNHRDSIYAVADRYMYKFWEGYSDNKGIISGILKTAYGFPSGRGTNSRITLIRPVLQSDTSTPRYTLRIDSDYEQILRLGRARNNINRTDLALWDDAIWDEDYWVGSERVSQDWTTVNHYVGKAISIRMRINSLGQNISVVAFDLITQSGGMI